MSETWAVERGCEPTEAEIRERLRGVPLSERGDPPTKTGLLGQIGLDHLRGARRRRAVVVIQRVWSEVLLARLERLREERDEWRSQARDAGVRLTALEPVEQALRVQLQAARERADRWEQVAALLGVIVVLASVLAGLAAMGVW